MRPALLALFGLMALSGALGASACDDGGDDGPGAPDAMAPGAPDAMAPGAPDAMAPGAPDAMAGMTCRSTNECTDSALLCLGPNQPNCGIPPREECTDDQGCGAYQRCHAVADGCSPDGVGATCGPACTAGDTSCGEGFTCDGGACVAVLCDEGFACRVSETCDPSSIVSGAPVADRHHGCKSIGCQDDEVCPADTFCVNGICQDGLGTCTPPAP